MSNQEGISPPKQHRKCSNFLHSYLEYTEDSESPELFHFWSAISIISASLGRKCYVSRGHFDCFPNQYIILVSDSARCRKTTAADTAISLYRKAEGSVKMEKLTPEYITRYLAEEAKNTGTSSVYIYSPELGTFLNANSYSSGLMLLVTTLYGCPKEWEYCTKNKGSDNLKNVFMHILGCTVPSWLAKMPSDMVEGGFSSRCLFIVQNIPRSPRPRPEITARQKELEADLVHDLQIIKGITGEFKLTPSAGAYYDEWYCREYHNIDKADVRVKAYYARKGEHVLKVAMCLAAAEGDTTQLEHWHIEQALVFLKQIEALMPSAFVGVSFSESTRFMDKIMNQIEDEGGQIEHSKLMKRNYYYMDKEELRKVIETLLEGNLIRMEVRGSKRYYIKIGD